MAEAAPTYKTLSEVPQRWRKLNGVPLDLDHVNYIVQRAYALGKDGKPAYDGAREEFTRRYPLNERTNRYSPKPKGGN